jgi:hypothetical protein
MFIAANWCLLDNLFVSVPLARALRKCGIGLTGTTRKNSKGIPQWLLDLKQENKELIWDSALGEVISEEDPQNPVLVFLWQDNNAVIGTGCPPDCNPIRCPSAF